MLFAWGRNSDGQCGADLEPAAQPPMPRSIRLPHRARSVACGTGQQGCTFAVLEDGSLWTWGNDAGGRLGHPAPRADGPVARGPPSAGTNATPRKVEALAAVHVMQACVSDFHGECFRE